MTNKTRKNVTRKSVIKNNITKKILDGMHKETDDKKYKSFEFEFSKRLKNKQTINQIENDLAKAFLKPFSPKGIKPNDDFYTYINYQWLSNVEKHKLLKKKFYTQYDDFRIIQEKVYYDLINIVNDYIKNEKGPLRNEIKHLFDSLNCDKDDKVENQILITRNKIDKFVSEDDLYGLLAYCNRNELVNFACPIAWSVKQDLHNPQVFRSHLTMTKLPYYDLDLYVINDTDSISRKQYKTFFKNRYVKYCKDLFDMIDYKKDRDYEWLFNCGREIYLTMGSNSVPENDKNFYNIVKKEDAHKYNFDWIKFTKALGYDNAPDFFIVDNLSYLKSMMEILNKEWKTPKWREWFLYINVKQQIRFHEKYYKIYFSFYRKFVQGAEFKVPKQISPVFVLSLCFDKLLSTEYIKKFGVKENIDYVENLVTDLKLVYTRIIENNDWLSPKTKKYALLKLKHLKIIIGSPETLLDDPMLHYTNDDVWENIEKIYKWRLDKYISLEGRQFIDIPSVDWTDLKLVGRQCYIVNAFYTPQRNDIYIPLAYLQRPFLDLNERGMEYNLAYLGFTISHELSHALDDNGSKYDYEGKFKNWWTNGDRLKYNKKIQDVIKQYEIFALNDNIKFDASMSAGEDLADISAITICEQYLRDFQIKNEYIIPIRNLSFTNFFTYFAHQMRQSIAKKAYRVQMVTNPHPLDKYRVNVPLSRLKLFRSIYNVKKGDKMYWKNIESIW